MTILYLIEEIGGGGKERRLVELLKGLVRAGGYDLHLVLTKSKIDYPEIHQVPIKIHYLNGYSNIGLFFRYFKVLNAVRPHVVHTWSIKTSFYAAFLKPLLGYKLVSGFITNTFGCSKRLNLLNSILIFRLSDRILSNSVLGLKSYDVPFEKGVVIPNGFNSCRITERDVSKRNLRSLGVDTILTVIMVANVTPKKDYESFINVALKITSEFGDVSFVAVGNIESRFDDMVFPYILNKHERIKFVGFHGDPVQFIRESDIGLLCSDKEGISNSIMEYMAAGLPVVCTDLDGGTRELLVDNEGGFLCTKLDLASKLKLLIENESLRLKFGNNNLERIRSHFSIESMISKFSEFYNSL